VYNNNDICSPTVESNYHQFIMIASTILLVCLEAMIPVVMAQTPPGFSPSVAQPLKVAYGANDISPAGEMVARPGNYSTQMNR
jgi:hypothetical protein